MAFWDGNIKSYFNSGNHIALQTTLEWSINILNSSDNGMTFY